MENENNKPIKVNFDIPNLSLNISGIFTEIGSMITESLQVNFKSMFEALNGLTGILDDVYAKNMHVYKKMGKLGWDFSNNFPISYIHPVVKHIGENIDDEEEINDTFVNLYKDDYVDLLIEPIKITLDKLKDIKSRDKMLNLLNGSVEMYKTRNYDASVCLLTPLIEGIFSSKIDHPNKKGILEELNGLKNKEDGGIIASKIIIVKEYIDGFLKYVEFDKDEPDNCINRHWVAHGRSYTTFKSIDCLRLLCMINAILDVIEFCYD